MHITNSTFLRHPLDEATSALDNRTEAHVLVNVFNLSKLFGLTVLVIAHKLTSILDADHITVMHRGAAIEAGTHAQLLRKKGFYYTMFKTQVRGEDELRVGVCKSDLFDR